MIGYSNVQAFTMTVAAFNAVLAVIVWTLLRHSPRRLPAGLWSLGVLANAFGLPLIALRGMVPEVLSYLLANALIFGGYVLRLQALRIALGRPWPLLQWTSWWLVPLGIHAVLWRAVPPVVMVSFGYVVNIVGTLALAGHARALGRAESSPNATLIARIEAVLAVSLSVRWFCLTSGLVAPQPFDITWDFLQVAIVGFICGTYGTLAYMALLLDQSRVAQLRASALRQDEQLRREAAERTGHELRELLGQRDRLVAERDRLLRVLAHEIHQPLHNAGGALQSAVSVLAGSPGAMAEAASTRLARARAVLGEVHSVLGNTLTASEILTQGAPLARQEVEIDLLVALTLGDLDDALRQRVEVRHLTPLRTVVVDPGLMRVALRNLLRNAFIHGGETVRVRLDITDHADPDGLAITVEDDGPGLNEAQAKALGGDAGDSAWPPDARGLGLFIVRRAMALHGGHLQLSNTAPRGLRARIVLPDLPADLAAP